MPTPDADANPPHNPFSLLKAILIGTAIGFLVVLAAPYLVPAHRAPLTYATADMHPDPVKVSAAANRSTQKHSLSGDVKTTEAEPRPPAEPGSQVPAGSAPSPEAKEPEDREGRPAPCFKRRRAWQGERAGRAGSRTGCKPEVSQDILQRGDDRGASTPSILQDQRWRRCGNQRRHLKRLQRR